MILDVQAEMISRVFEKGAVAACEEGTVAVYEEWVVAVCEEDAVGIREKGAVTVGSSNSSEYVMKKDKKSILSHELFIYPFCMTPLDNQSIVSQAV